MLKALTPIFALIIAVGLGVTYIKPEFAKITASQAETKRYVDAIEKASQLKDLIDKKVQQINSFNPVDMDRLQTILPENVHEVAVMLDLDALARAHRLSLSDIKVEKSALDTTTPPPIAPADPNAPPGTTPAEPEKPAYISRDISFTVTGTYEDFRKFVQGLEQSLVFFDVQTLSFSQSQGDLTAFKLKIRTYAFTK